MRLKLYMACVIVYGICIIAYLIVFMSGVLDRVSWDFTWRLVDRKPPVFSLKGGLLGGAILPHAFSL